MKHLISGAALAALLSLLGGGCSEDEQPVGADAADAALDGGGDGMANPDAVHDGAADGSTTKAPQVVTCPNATMTPPTTGTCSVTKGSTSGVLVRGAILTPDKVYDNGHLLISQGKIACAGCDCSKHSAYSGATQVVCARGVVSPGLINPHDHLGWTKYAPVPTTERYDHRHEWRVGANGKKKITYGSGSYAKDALAWGELRMIIGGSTSIMGAAAGADKLLRNLDGDNEGLTAQKVMDDTFPLGDSSGTLIGSGCSYSSYPSVSTVKAAPAYIPHVSEGGIQAARNELLCLNGIQSGGVDVALNTSAFIHSVGLTVSDAADMALSGTMVVWSPRSNISLYGYTAEVVMLHNTGVKIALGTDWTISGSMNMLRELACADLLSTTYYGGFFKDYQLWEMATIRGAQATGTDKELGILKEGYWADVAIFDGSKNKHFAAVVRANAASVVLVMRGGEVLVGDKDLVTALDSGGGASCEALTDCLSGKLVCAKRETGKTLSELKSSVGSSAYALFFCTTPTSEPTCVPYRPTEYDGKVTSTDSDGDGLPDSTDLCPKVFSPLRKLNNGVQPDGDGDKVGDACDLCPLDANTSVCKTKPTANDKDGDSLADSADNCPYVANKDQKDTDGDKIGDLCDDCPKANPGGAACPYLVKELRDQSLGKRPTDGTKVKVQAVTITSVCLSTSGCRGFYVREGTSDHQAIFIYTASSSQTATNGTPLAAGQVVSVEGLLKEYNKIDEIEKPTSITITGSGLYDPVSVKTDKLQQGSTTAEALESHLVKVSTVTVAVGPTSTSDSFWVTDSGSACSGTTPACTQVGDFTYDGSTVDGKPAAKQADTFTSITGVVNGFKDLHTLDVRTDADLVK